jgi:hypothetical protein
VASSKTTNGYTSGPNPPHLPVALIHNETALILKLHMSLGQYMQPNLQVSATSTK